MTKSNSDLHNLEPKDGGFAAAPREGKAPGKPRPVRNASKPKPRPRPAR